MVERYSWEGQKRLAKVKIFPACEVLLKRGTEVDVDIYAGSLRRAVRSYAFKGDVHLIVTPTGNGLPLTRLAHSAARLFSPFSQPSSPAVLVSHPGAVL